MGTGRCSTHGMRQLKFLAAVLAVLFCSGCAGEPAATAVAVTSLVPATVAASTTPRVTTSAVVPRPTVPTSRSVVVTTSREDLLVPVCERNCEALIAVSKLPNCSSAAECSQQATQTATAFTALSIDVRKVSRIDVSGWVPFDDRLIDAEIAVDKLSSGSCSSKKITADYPFCNIDLFSLRFLAEQLVTALGGDPS